MPMDAENRPSAAQTEAEWDHQLVPSPDAVTFDPARWPLGPPSEHSVPPGWGSPLLGIVSDGGMVRTAELDATGPAEATTAKTNLSHVGNVKARGCAIGTVLIAVLSKVAVAAKLALPLLSALVSLVAYAVLFGWRFGLGIVLLLFVHEMGHFVVIRAKGLPASLPVFIPLLGAYVAMRRMPTNVRAEAEIALAGPLAGALAGVVCLAIGQQVESRFWLALAFFSFFLNLLNLIPVAPLDGGRVVGAISRWVLLLGLVLTVMVFLRTHNLLLLVLLWLGGMQTWERFGTSERPDYYRIPLLARAYVAVVYFGLAGGLALGMVATQHLMGFTGRPFGI